MSCCFGGGSFFISGFENSFQRFRDRFGHSLDRDKLSSMWEREEVLWSSRCAFAICQNCRSGVSRNVGGTSLLSLTHIPSVGFPALPPPPSNCNVAYWHPNPTKAKGRRIASTLPKLCAVILSIYSRRAGLEGRGRSLPPSAQAKIS